MRSPAVRPVVLAVLAGTAVVCGAATGPAADAAPKFHQCKGKGRAADLYPWVANLHGVTTGKACATIVALGKSVSGESFPSLESLITCSPAPTDASGAATGPGTASLTQTTWHSWSLSYSTNGALKLSKAGASFHAGQQDFGCN